MKVNRVFSFLLIFSAATAVYFFGFLFISSAAETTNMNNTPAAVIHRGKINPFPDKSLFIGQLDSGRAYNVVIRETDKLDYMKSIECNELEGLITSDSKNPVINPYYADILTLPGFLADFSRDLDRFNSEILKLHNKSDYYLIFIIISQILFASACWSLLRISRWPLINGFISLILVRGLFAGYTLWDAEKIRGSFSFISSGVISDNIFPILLSSAAVFIFLLDGIISGVRKNRRDAVK